MPQGSKPRLSQWDRVPMIPPLQCSEKTERKTGSRYLEIIFSFAAQEGDKGEQGSKARWEDVALEL